MKNLYVIFAVIFVSALFGCSKPFYALVSVNDGTEKEAFQAAYLEALAMGYTSELVDRDKGVAVFNMADDSRQIYLRIELQPRENNNEPPRFKVYIMKRSTESPDSYEMKTDVREVGAVIEDCCLRAGETRQFKRDRERGYGKD